MAEWAPTWRGPLDDAQPIVDGDALRIAPLAPVARLAVRCGPQAAAAAGRALGVTLPLTPCRSESVGTRSALWLGPDEWMLVVDLAERDAVIAALRDALAVLPASVVDVSDRLAAVAVEGPRAADVINSGCPLDLDPAAFPVGMCTRTLYAKAEIVLWRTGDSAFEVSSGRSFMPYVLQHFAVAARDQG